MNRLTGIFRYPVKSMRGIALAEAEVSPYGLPLDRAWMVIDAAGQMVTARSDPRLVTVAVALDGTSLTLRVPQQAPLVMASSDFIAPVQATVWRDTVDAWAGSTPADACLSEWLGKAVRLCFIGRQPGRRLSGFPEVAIGFADAYPLLLVSEASLADLNARLAHAVTATHFRPNLVISGTTPFAEDGWQRLRIGEAVFRLEKPCERCVLTTVDPLTGEKSADQEPLRTLAGFRKSDAGILFGQNLRVEQAGRIRVGMPVEILD